MDEIKIFVKATEEIIVTTPTMCEYGSMPEMNIPGDTMNTYKPDEYDPLTKDNKRCSRFKSERTDTLAKIMDDKDEHPIVRGLAKEEYFRRLVRDYVPDTRAGETAEVKMAKILENKINNLSFSQRQMADHFCQYAHRSLDKDLFNGFISRYIIVHAWKWRNSKPGTGPMYYDGRNEYVCEQCSKIVDALEWGYYYDEYCREMAKKMNR